VTAFINEYYDIYQSRSKGASADGWKGLKTQAAAQSPTGSIVTLVDIYGDLYRLNTEHKSLKKQDRAHLEHTCSGDPDNMIAISMLDDNTTHAFWIVHGKVDQMIFATIGLDEKPCKKVISIPDDIFRESM
jgi:RNA polymerase-interacting CarD/CdnL/TRCF family regulator